MPVHNSRRRVLTLVLLAAFAAGVAFAVWNSTQPHIRLFIVNEGSEAAVLRFGDGRSVAVPPCTSERYSDDVGAEWTLSTADRELRRDALTAVSGAIVTVTIAADGVISSEVAQAIDTGVLSARAPDVGACATATDPFRA